MTIFYLIRHAEAEGNVYRRIHGQYDSLITPRGLRQIECLAERMISLHIDAVYSSDLYRAKRTAAAVYHPRGMELITDKRFREIYMGSWEDLTFGEMIYSEPEQTRNLDIDPWHWVAGDSEPFSAVTARFISALSELAEKFDGGTVAVVSHGLAIRSAMCGFLGVSDASGYSKAPPSDNTSVTRVLYNNGQFTIESAADTSHIPPNLSTREHHRVIRTRFNGDNWNMRFIKNGEYNYEAFIGDSFAGYIRLSPEYGGETGIITEMELEQQYRGKGLGVQLIGQAVSVFRGMGKTRIYAGLTEEVAEAAGFFISHGFKIAGTDKNCLEMNISIEHAGAI